jgi:hypothetical protein
VVEYLTQLPIPFTNFVEVTKSRLAQLTDEKSDTTQAMQVEEGHEPSTTNGDSDTNMNEETKTDRADPTTNTTTELNNERRDEILKLLENVSRLNSLPIKH